MQYHPYSKSNFIGVTNCGVAELHSLAKLWLIRVGLWGFGNVCNLGWFSIHGSIFNSRIVK
jgi:hypothetical protein